MQAGGSLLPFKWPRFLGSLAFLAAWVTPWRPAFPVHAKSGLRFYVHHRDAIGRHIAKYGMHEPLVTGWISKFLDSTSAALVVDIGANLGWHALHAAKHPNVERVVAFEPDPFNAWLLERNLAENGIGNVILDTRAVGAASGVAQFYRYKSSNAGRHSLAVDHGYGSRFVVTTGLDGALAGMGFGERRIALIKIDVEGYEPAVIAGASTALERTDALIVEHSPDWSRTAGLSAEDALRRLESLHFVPFVLLSTGGTARTSYDALSEFQGSLDVVFVAPERVAALTQGSEDAADAGALLAIAERNKRVK